MNPSASLSSSSSGSWLSGFVRSYTVKSSTPNMANTGKSASGDASFGSGQRKNQLGGVLFKYGPSPVQVAFKTGDFKQQVIFIGGLTDGLLATSYLEPLSVALEREKWSLVQPLLSSSYTGYGTSSLKQSTY
ncbi:hypothetical protein EJ110_NYTH13884 [Nymphaea thermarum]|nr:hypothetical protein EJ110_NYTH13884 [Nymphaea thermarum]